MAHLGRMYSPISSNFDREVVANIQGFVKEELDMEQHDETPSKEVASLEKPLFELALLQEKIASVKGICKTLCPRQAAAVKLIVMGGTAHDVADALQISEHAARELIARAIKNISRIVKQRHLA